jgi:hypothetical protein
MAPATPLGYSSPDALRVALVNDYVVERFRDLVGAVTRLDEQFRADVGTPRAMDIMLASAQRRDELASTALDAAPLLLALYDASEELQKVRA